MILYLVFSQKVVPPKLQGRFVCIFLVLLPGPHLAPSVVPTWFC